MLAFEAHNITKIITGLKEFYQDADKSHKIIMSCAITAAAVDGLGGMIPGIACVTTIISCAGAVWSMYGLLCKTLGITLKHNVLKILSRAALTNIAINLGSAFLAVVAAQMIPGASVLVSAAITFISVYLAGLLFLQMVLSMAQKSKDPSSFSDISEHEMKKTISSIRLSKEDLNAAKEEFLRHKSEIEANPEAEFAQAE